MLVSHSSSVQSRTASANRSNASSKLRPRLSTQIDPMRRDATPECGQMLSPQRGARFGDVVQRGRRCAVSQNARCGDGTTASSTPAVGQERPDSAKARPHSRLLLAPRRPWFSTTYPANGARRTQTSLLILFRPAQPIVADLLTPERDPRLPCAGSPPSSKWSGLVVPNSRQENRRNL